MSASIMEIGRLNNGSRIPVSDYEEPYGRLDNHISVPYNVLWQEARNGITKLVHFSYASLHTILGQAEVELPNHYEGVTRAEMTINSRVITGSFGRGRAGHQLQFPNTITLELTHDHPMAAGSSPLCVAWSYSLSAWTSSGCSLVTSDPMASVCQCDMMTAWAVMETSGDHVSMGHQASSPVMTLQIVTYIVAAISLLCVVLILVKVRILPKPSSA